MPYLLFIVEPQEIPQYCRALRSGTIVQNWWNFTFKYLNSLDHLEWFCFNLGLFISPCDSLCDFFFVARHFFISNVSITINLFQRVWRSWRRRRFSLRRAALTECVFISMFKETLSQAWDLPRNRSGKVSKVSSFPVKQPGTCSYFTKCKRFFYWNLLDNLQYEHHSNLVLKHWYKSSA